LAASRCLSRLQLSCCGIKPAVAAELAGGAGRCVSLTHLDLANNKIGDGGAAALGGALAGRVQLQVRAFGGWGWGRGWLWWCGRRGGAGGAGPGRGRAGRQAAPTAAKSARAHWLEPRCALLVLSLAQTAGRAIARPLLSVAVRRWLTQHPLHLAVAG
jgi:hypothetical protein